MKVRIETYEPGPTEVRITNLNSAPTPSRVVPDQPGAVHQLHPVNHDSPSSVPGQPLDGFVTLGQGAFRVLGSVSRKRKNNTGEGNG